MFPAHEVRESFADQYISGAGIEVGALNNPMKVPSTARVTYIDRHPFSRLQNEQFPELMGTELARVDVIDDAESLETFQDASCDFVILNHVIEHCKNTLKGFDAFFRVLKPGGILFMTAPDKRYTFDKDRPVTPLSHLIQDYEQGSEQGDPIHYEEYIKLVDKITSPEEFNKRLKYLLGIDYSIHFHVWDFVGFTEVINFVKEKIPFEILVAQENGNYESLFIMRKV